MLNSIVSISLSVILAHTNFIGTYTKQIPFGAGGEIVSVEKMDLRNNKIKQVEELLKVQYEKIERNKERIYLNNKRIESERKMKEEQRLLEEQNKQPHFNPYDVTELSNLNKEQIYKMLEGTDLVTLVDALYWYEQEYKVNLIFITSIVALESGWGRSSLAISHNNLTGYIGSNGEYYVFNDWGENVQETFRLISEEYTSEEGLFYNGKSVWNINQKYCELDSWSNKIIDIGNDLLLKARL